jgi:hypothetical protein
MRLGGPALTLINPSWAHMPHRSCRPLFALALAERVVRHSRNLRMTSLESFRLRTRIAYFSMEIALRPEIHTYSGGLGVRGSPARRRST